MTVANEPKKASLTEWRAQDDARRLITAAAGFVSSKKDGIEPDISFVAENLFKLKDGTITEQEFMSILFETARSVRNRYMRKEEQMMWPYTPDELAMDEALLEFKEPARNMIVNALGYAPDVQISLRAEMMMRVSIEALQEIDPSRRETQMHGSLTRALNNLKYREMFLAQGWEAADKSPLVTVDEAAIEKILSYHNSNF